MGWMAVGGGDGFLPSETFAKLPKQMGKAVSGDRCHSQIMGFWIPAPVSGHEDRLSAGMTEGGVYVRGLVGLGGGDGVPACTGTRGGNHTIIRIRGGRLEPLQGRDSSLRYASFRMTCRVRREDEEGRGGVCWWGLSAKLL